MGGTPIQIRAREAQRLKERFVTRARALFYARLAFLSLAVAVVLMPSWRQALDAFTPYVAGGFFFALSYAVAALLLAEHRRHGRWVTFLTLNLDLLLMILVIAETGGIRSPAMAGVVLLTIFFALLFPNPIAIVPPMLTLPVVMRISQGLDDRPTLAFEILHILWYAVVNGAAVYVMVYLTGREEKQNREILNLEQELKKLAVVEERNRLARDIHDGLGAALSGLIIQAEYLGVLAKGDDELVHEIKEIKSASEEAIDEVRRALTMMRDEFELVPQLENVCTTFTTRHKIPANLTLSGTPPDFLSDEQQLTIFRILQECLTNIAKHAQPGGVVIDVSFGPEIVKLSIVDDGRGFDPSKTPKHHYGLINMRERARKIGGQVSIESEVGAGTRVELTITGRGEPGALTASA